MATAAEMSNNGGADDGSTMTGNIPEFVLPPCVKAILKQIQNKKDDDDPPPYTTDYEYMEAVVAVESARILAFTVSQGLTASFFNVDLKWRCSSSRGGSSVASSEFQKTAAMSVKELEEWLLEIVSSLETYRQEQLARMMPQRQPVLEAFLEKINANENEKRVFRFVVAVVSGMTGYAKRQCMVNPYEPQIDFVVGGPGGGDGYFDNQSGMAALQVKAINCRLLNELFDVPMLELFAMAHPQSSWAKEHFLADCKSHVLAPFVRMRSWKAHPFLGTELSVSEFEGLNSELLREVLLQDPIFQQTATGKTILKMKEMETLGPAEASLEDRSSKRKSGPNEFDFMEEYQAAQLAAAGGGSKHHVSVLEILSMAREKKLSGVYPDDEMMKPPMNEMMKTTMDNDDSEEDAVLVKDDVVISETTDSEGMGPSSEGGAKDTPDSILEEEFGPYKTDLGYLEDQVRIMEQARLLNRMQTSLLEDKFKEDKALFRDAQADEAAARYYGHPMDMMNEQMTDAQREEKKRKIEKLTSVMKKLEDRVGRRITATRRETGREMRLEQLCRALKLAKFEKYVILSLLKSIIMPQQNRNGFYDDDGHMRGVLEASVGGLINCFCSTLEEKMNHRSFFYRSSTLIREGIVSLKQHDFMKELTNCTVDLDRRMFDFLVGLDTEFSEIVDGSHLYLPSVSLDDVVLPTETKQRVFDVVMNFDKLKKKMRELDVQDKISYGLGQVLLFHGKSGTGKTMLANAIAAKANMKVLLINFPDLPPNLSSLIIKMLFREATINRALLFFDECESMFRSRDKGGASINMILTEIERFEGLCIMATNRPIELDEALHRRVSLAVEFRKPDHIMREAIWKKLHPPKVPIDDGIDFGFLANKFELSGGMIKNCWVSALGMMVQHGTDAISQEYLMQAAREQVIGQLTMDAFDRRVVPTHGLDTLVVSETIRESLNGIVQSKKAQSVLFGNWGFDELHRSTMGVSALFTGKPGTGKTLAAEAVGYEVGQPLLVVNVAELVSKWVGETGKNIEAIFGEAKKKDAVLVFDEAEGLFGTRSSSGDGSTSRHDNMNVGLLLHYIENFSGICIVITNLKEAMDEAFFRRFRFVISFDDPGIAEREKIWKQMVPKACPLASNVSFGKLASRFELRGGEIKQALMRAASKAALRTDEKDRVIKMDDLETACRQELDKKEQQRLAASMYS